LKNYKEELISGKIKIGVWGCGYIGYTTLVNYANKGIFGVGTDTNKELINIINKGEIPLPNLDYWLGFPVKPLIENGFIKVIENWKELIDDDEVLINFICIPTENGAEPWDNALIDVVDKLIQKEIKDPIVVIIESTLTPGKCDQILISKIRENGFRLGKDFIIGVAPRRDWFISPDKNLRTLPRIVGGDSKKSTNIIYDILSIICDNLIKASSYREAELVKSIENAYRHVGITLANQLAIAYPNVNIKEVLRLVGTKWNIPTYYPSIGTGGYCIPLSSKYVSMGSKKPEELTILRETIQYDTNLPKKIIKNLLKKYNCKSFAILGIAYKADLKVHILSPALRIIKYLLEKDIFVKVFDPYYTKEEIKNITNCETFKYPQELSKFDCIIIIPNHRLFTQTPKNNLFQYLNNIKVI